MVAGFRRRSRGARAGGLVAVGALVAGAVCAVGAIGAGSGNDVIRACVAKKTGAVRIVSAKRRCRNTERTVTWNRRGTRGPAGEKGRAGAPGQGGGQGPAGTAAASTIIGNTDADLAGPAGGPAPPGSTAMFAPSGFAPGTANLGANLQVSPNTPIVVRDLFVRLGNAPGPGASRIVELLAGSKPALSCTISGTDDSCTSGDATTTVPPGSDLTIRQTVALDGGPAATAPGLRWGFRALTP